jgi:hypothetical protein
MIEIDMNFFAKSVSERFAPKSQHFNAVSVCVYHRAARER